MFHGMGIAELAIAIIVIIAVVAILWVFIKQSGVPIPGWLIQVFWIVLAAIVCIAAIKFVISM